MMKQVQHKTIDALITDLEHEVGDLQDKCVQIATKISDLAFELLETMPEDERLNMEQKMDELMFIQQETRDKAEQLKMHIEQIENF